MSYRVRYFDRHENLPEQRASLRAVVAALGLFHGDEWLDHVMAQHYGTRDEFVPAALRFRAARIVQHVRSLHFLMLVGSIIEGLRKHE